MVSALWLIGVNAGHGFPNGAWIDGGSAATR